MSDQATAQNQSQSDDAAQISNSQKLATFSRILDEVESSTTSSADGENNTTSTSSDQPTAGSTSKEQLEGFAVSSQELPGGMKQVEAEPNPEIPPELESYLQKVEESDQQETAQKLADLSQEYEDEEIASDPQSAKVLPITKQQEKEGLRRSAAYSIKWLVEFSRKMTKKFLGRAVYRQPESEENR